MRQALCRAAAAAARVQAPPGQRDDRSLQFATSPHFPSAALGKRENPKPAGQRASSRRWQRRRAAGPGAAAAADAGTGAGPKAKAPAAVRERGAGARRTKPRGEPSWQRLRNVAAGHQALGSRIESQRPPHTRLYPSVPCRHALPPSTLPHHRERGHAGGPDAHNATLHTSRSSRPPPRVPNNGRPGCDHRGRAAPNEGPRRSPAGKHHQPHAHQHVTSSPFNKSAVPWRPPGQPQAPHCLRTTTTTQHPSAIIRVESCPRGCSRRPPLPGRAGPACRLHPQRASTHTPFGGKGRRA